MSDPLETLRQAVAQTPGSENLRLLLALRLLEAGRAAEAAEHAAAVLVASPDNIRAQHLLDRALGIPPDPSDAAPRSSTPPAQEAAPPPNVPPIDFAPPGLPSMFANAAGDPEARYQPVRSTVTLADVAGLADVKARLEASFLAPLRNPELRAMYGKSLRGGMLLYGPPGCGKTFLARAVAGEMGARFLAITIADVLDRWLGASEQNIHEIFVQARLESPVVLFIDEIDALGGRRNRSSDPHMATITNQLLHELDGLGNDNEGVYVMGATNRPWDMDPALRRPGRFDRTLLVTPPDAPAREAIFRDNLRSRPIQDIDLVNLGRQTEGFSGADIAAACEAASEFALLDAARTGFARLIGMTDVRRAVSEIRPSTRSWFDSVRPVVQYDSTGEFAPLKDYMKQQRML